ncbi:MAG: TlpA family protein disulfide reductase [Anaerolineales bacterium]|nr:TlpA family protein disulfide reductase [Anaerolineales bacterium]
MENLTNNSSGHPVNALQVKEKKPTRQWNFGSFLSSVLLLGLVGFLAWGMSNNRRGQVDQGSAPDFSITSFDGETLTLSELRGQVVVLNFWASWCPPCREEAPYLEETWRKYQDKGVVFIGVDYVDVEPEALAYIEEFNITYFNGPDLRTTISQAYNIQGVPETFFVKKNGEIGYVHVGPLIPPDLEWEIDKLLSEPYPTAN